MKSISAFSLKHFFLLLLPICGSSQTNLQPGDLYFLSYRSDAPDGFSFVVWKPVHAGTSISFTDNGWVATDTTAFSYTTESILTWSYQGSKPLKAGAVMVVDCGQLPCTVNRGQVTGAMNGLSSTGDQLFAFQGRLDSVHFLAAINFDGTSWATDRFNANTSALPNELQGVAMHLDESDNGHYVGLRSGHTLSEYLGWVTDTDNGWLTYDQPGIFISADTTSFSIIPEAAAPNWTLPHWQLGVNGRNQGQLQWQWPAFDPHELGEPALLLCLNNSYHPQDSAFAATMGIQQGIILLDTTQYDFNFPLNPSHSGQAIRLYALHNYNGHPIYELLVDTLWFPFQVNEPLLPTVQSRPINPGFKQPSHESQLPFKWWIHQGQLYWKNAHHPMYWELHSMNGSLVLQGEVNGNEGRVWLKDVGMPVGIMNWWIKDAATHEWMPMEREKVWLY